MSAVTPRYLFVCGTARSGTSAMWRLLIDDPRIAMGLERYVLRVGKDGLSPELFEERRFFDLQPGDTFYEDLEGFNPYYGQLRQRYADAEFVGDKIPRLFAHLDSLFEAFPTAKVIVMVRNIFDVAASYESRADAAVHWSPNRRTPAAIRDWGRMLRSLDACMDDARVYPVLYEDFFGGQGDLAGLYEFIGLSLEERAFARFAGSNERSARLEGERRRALSQSNVLDISLHAPFELYRSIVARVRDRTRAVSGPPESST